MSVDGLVPFTDEVLHRPCGFSTSMLMPASGEPDRGLDVVLGRYGDHSEVDLADYVIKRRNSSCARWSRSGERAWSIVIDDGDQMCAAQQATDAGVVRSHDPGTDDRQAK